jgi:hypothetical protein
MIRQNRKTRSFGRVGAVALGVFFAASLLLALRPANSDGSPGDRMRNRREALRASEIRVMDIFGQNYGGADWSLVTSDLESHPSGPANPAFMSVPLSLANVYLNRYEVGHDKANLDRSVELLEWVAANRGIWGGRDGTGSVVSYLDISLARVRAECDIGGFEARIDELWQSAMTITAEEADALLAAGWGPDRPCAPTLWLPACTESILPYPPESEAQASRAALFSAAASFLQGDSRAAAWAQGAQLAARFPGAVCQTAQTELDLSQGALSFLLSGGDAPAELQPVTGARGSGRSSSACSTFPTGYETSGPVALVDPATSLASAIRDSRVVAYYVSELYLWHFPPGSQCSADDDIDTVSGRRF